MNSGNNSISLQFWWTIWNPMLFCVISYIVLIMRQLQCLLCPKANIVCTRFVQIFLCFYRTKIAQNNSQNFRLRNHNLLYKYNPASEALLQKRKSCSNYHIIEIICFLCILYDRLIILGKRLLRDLFIRSLYWNSYYLCIIYMALWK